MKRRATRDDVARLAKTSTAVVSYVINNGPRNVSEEKRARVQDAMRQLDYFPNALARSLAATSTSTVALIVPNISNSFFAELARQIEEVARNRGRIVFLGNSNESAELETAYVEAFVQQRVGGILIIGVAQSAALARAAASGIPVVVVDRAMVTDTEEIEWSTVSIDHRSAARIAVDHLLEHGHRQIACVTGPENQAVAEDRRLGWADSLRSSGIDAERQLRLNSPFSLEGGNSAAEQFFAEKDPPRALFVASDEQARGFVSYAAQLGVRVPDDIAIVSVDGTRESEFLNPPLTTAVQPYRLLAEAAIDSLDQSRHGGTQHTYLDTHLQIRRSCGCEHIAKEK